MTPTLTSARRPAPLTFTARAEGLLLGLAVGDALGTSVEFKPRGSFEPLTDMLGGGPFDLPAGAWTDDTSMALCLAESLIQKRAFDARDQMERYWCWYSQGYWSSTGACFDIGNTTRAALNRFDTMGLVFAGSSDPRSAGNGCIMRSGPIAVATARLPLTARISWAARSARVTHAAPECLCVTAYFNELLVAALLGASKREVLALSAATGIEPVTERTEALLSGSFFAKRRDQIRGSGYVVESCEAALWCVAQSEDYDSAVLRAANLGEDADTTAAICGQLAGALYGVEAIRPSWREKLARGEEIVERATRLAAISFSA